MNNGLMLKLKDANTAYRSGNPIISDEEFDYLLRELEAQITPNEFREFRQTLMEESGDVKHNFIIGSLNKIRYGENELGKWLKKIKPDMIFWSDKLDGMSFVAEYFDGKLTKLVSRGDGYTGQNLTNKIKYINIPNKLRIDFSGQVRGELVLTGNSHNELGFKNRRNATVGIMGRDEIIPDSLKHVKAYAYEIITSKNNIQSQFDLLIKLGFVVPRFGVIKRTMGLFEDILRVTLEEDTDYDKDGLVISSPNYCNENIFLPQGKTAFKVNSEGIEAIVENVLWEISKNYLLKPVAQLKPVELDGVTISNVTCYNYDYVVDNGIGKEAVISLVRSGGVIPKVVGIIKKSLPSVPEYCPNCNSDLRVYGVDLQCTNEDCSAATVKQVESFIKELGIENVSEDRLKQWGIFTFNDLLNWKPDFNYKTQTTFNDELEDKVFKNSKEILTRSFTCEGVGTTNFDKLLKAFGGLDKLHNFYCLTEYNSVSADYSILPVGVGMKTIDKSRSDWKRNHKILLDIISDSRYNYTLKETIKEAKIMSGNKLEGKTFLATGKFSISQSELENKITSNGGVIAPSVTRTLDYLLCADNSRGVSSKWIKADKLGIKIITEQEFNEMI